jgi:O-antigen/teichoic acid export membrane protein
MLEKLLKLGKHTIIYGVGNALTAIGAFILIPLYTHVLSTKEYGILELLNRTADILILVIVMGVRQAFIRFYFDHDDEDWHQRVIATTIGFLLFSSVILIMIFFPFREIAAEILFDDPLIGVLFLYVFIWIPLDLMVNVGMTHFQIQMMSTKYVIISITKFFLFVGSNVVLVYYYRMGITGVLITNIWVSALIGIGFLIYYIHWTKFRVSLPLLKDLLKFGLPYLPTAFFGYIINNGDRYFLKVYASLEEVGIYALGFKIGMFGLALIVEPFGRVWSPFLFDNYDKPDGPQLISKVFTIYTLIVVAVALGISVAAPFVIPVISDTAFHDSFKIVPVICLAAIFYDLAIMADAGILIKKRTEFKPLIFGLAAVVGTISNFIFVPLYKGIGAAIALSITFLSLFIINFSISNKFYYIRLEYRKMILIFTSAFVVYLISKFVLSLGPQDLLHQIYSMSVFLFFPLILWYGGLLTPREKDLVLKFIRRSA